MIDPDSGVMKKGDEYIQGYKCQMAIGGKGIIVATDASKNPGTRASWNEW